MSADFPSRVLVTGATGFIGGQLARRLHALGCQTHVIVRSGSNATSLAGVLGPSRIHVHEGTTAGMLEIVRSARPEVVFHLASLFLAQHRTEDVTGLVRSNVEFGAQLAEAAAICGTPHVINTGTAWQHFDDADYNPVNLYAATKQALAHVLRYYAEAGAFRVTTLELFDTYGPGDTRPKLFAALRKAQALGEPLAMSSGEQFIDLVYAEDVIEAFVMAAQAAFKARAGGGPLPFETYALSSGRPIRLRDLVALWQRVTGQELRLQWGARPPRAREVIRPWTRGRILPGWKPRVELEEGLALMERFDHQASDRGCP